MFDDTAFHLMRVILQEHNARWNERMPDLTKPQYAVLEALDTTDGLGQTELGEASATTKATLTEMLNRMEHRGLITRHPDSTDARRRNTHIAPEGRRLLAAARTVAADLEHDMLANFSPNELRRFVADLARLRGALHESPRPH